MPAIMLADPGMRGMQGGHDQYHMNFQLQQATVGSILHKILVSSRKLLAVLWNRIWIHPDPKIFAEAETDPYKKIISNPTSGPNLLRKLSCAPL